MCACACVRLCGICQTKIIINRGIKGEKIQEGLKDKKERGDGKFKIQFKMKSKKNHRKTLLYYLT